MCKHIASLPTLASPLWGYWNVKRFLSLCICFHLHLQSFVPGQRDWATQHGVLLGLDRCEWQNQELCFSYSCNNNRGQSSLLRVSNVTSHTWGGGWRLVLLMCNRGWILTSVPQVVPSLGMLSASACSWSTCSTWCELREPQSKALLWVRRCSRRWLELRPSCACGHSEGCGRAAVLGVPRCTHSLQEQCLLEYQHPKAAALHPGTAFTGYVYSSCRWRGTAAPTSVPLFMCLFKLLQLLEAKPTVSSAAAGFLPPHSCIRLFLAVLPSKSKKPQWIN